MDNNLYINNIQKKLKKNKVLIYLMYGQTEASPRMSYLNPKYI